MLAFRGDGASGMACRARRPSAGCALCKYTQLTQTHHMAQVICCAFFRFAKFRAKLAMLCIFPLRNCYEIVHCRAGGDRNGLRPEKNEIQTPQIAIFPRKLSIFTKPMTSMIESISRTSKLGSILRFVVNFFLYGDLRSPHPLFPKFRRN